MRAMFTAASLLLSIGLFGCDQAEKTQAPVVAAAPPCNCQQPVQAAAATPVVARVHRRGHHHAWHWREHENASSETSYESQESSSESASSYSSSEYSSSSREYRGGSETYQEGGAAQGEAQEAAWVDGYGRSHYASTGAVSDKNPADVSGEVTRARLAPWRGFNSKCADKGS